ncbi:MAG: SRPBCC domain-containing protein [Candidatus Dormibacteria bacterium]
MTKANHRAITITRTYDAPRELVFKAWTGAGRLAQWWGPVGFTTSSAESDSRVGRALKLMMRGADGLEIVVTGTYREIVPSERLVVESSASEPGGHTSAGGEAHRESGGPRWQN